MCYVLFVICVTVLFMTEATSILKIYFFFHIVVKKSAVCVDFVLFCHVAGKVQQELG